MHCLRLSTLSFLSLVLLGSDAFVHAAIFDFQVRTPSVADPPQPLPRRSHHFARADSNSSSSSSRGPIPVANTLNAEYISNITLGGRTIPVLLDTGRHAPILLYDLSVLGILTACPSHGVVLTFG